MERARCLLLDGDAQEDYVLPCCVFFSTDVCLFVNVLGFIEEHPIVDQHTVVPRRAFPSRIVPLYVFATMEAFADSRLNFYRMLWNSKWNARSFLPAATLLLLRKYAVQNDRFTVQTCTLVADKAYDNDIPHLIIKFF